MTRKPTTRSARRSRRSPPPRPLEAAAKPVEAVGQTLERAFDPLTSALKRAA